MNDVTHRNWNGSNYMGLSANLLNQAIDLDKCWRGGFHTGGGWWLGVNTESETCERGKGEE